MANCKIDELMILTFLESSVWLTIWQTSMLCFCFVCLLPASFVPNVASFSVVPISDCPFGIL
jgi:hypothetical protein